MLSTTNSFKFRQPLANRHRAVSEGQQEHDSGSLMVAALRVMLREFIDLPEFLRQRKELIKEPRLAFENPSRKSWKGPFKFAILAGLYLGLFSDLLFSTWAVMPSSLRNKQFIGFLSDEQKQVDDLQHARVRIIETPIDGVNTRIARYNERVTELSVARASLPPTLVAHETEDLGRERSQIEHLKKELDESQASPIDSQYRDDLKQLDEDIGEAQEDLEHSKEAFALYERFMEFLFATYGVSLSAMTALSAYAFRFFFLIGRKKTPESIVISDGIYLYLVQASIFWNYVLCTLLGYVYLDVLWTHPALADTHWFDWIQKGGAIVATAIIFWTIHRIVKRASQSYPIMNSPWRALASVGATWFVSWLLCTTILIGVVALYAHFKAPWLIDMVFDANDNVLPI